MNRAAVLLVLATALLLSSPDSGEAQRFRRGRVPAYGRGLPDVPGEFTFCRLAYSSVRRDSSGSGWDTDFPNAERNFLTRLPELTRTRPSAWSNGEPGYAVVQATDPDIYRCPFVMATDVGELGFSGEEIEALRDYLAKGGFFWADDFWGSAGWAHFSREIRQLLPDHELVELAPEHPMFQVLYVIPGIPQIPSINSWRRSGGATSELGPDSAVPSMWAVLDEHERIVVLITHNTDISDGWEREAYDDRYFVDFSPKAYATGMNVLLWAMTR
jgi:hypothetical protein